MTLCICDNGVGFDPAGVAPNSLGVGIMREMVLVMPGMDGAQATRAIREKHPDIQVVALTSFEEKELVESALEAGAIGYLLKNVSALDARADAFEGKGEPRNGCWQP